MAGTGPAGMSAFANETTPLQDAGEEQGFPGGFFCCRKLAPVSFPPLAKQRKRVLYAAHCLAALGVALSAAAFIGAYSWGTTLSWLSWVTLKSPEGSGHAGVHWVCWNKPMDAAGAANGVTSDPNFSHHDVASFIQGHSRWQCKSWADYDCAKSKVGQAPCEECKVQSMGIAVSVFIGLITYASFLKKTDARLKGDDSNFTKFMAVFSALVGGTNFLTAVIAYWYTCIVHVDGDGPGGKTRVHAGAGLVFISIAAVLKVFMGLLHLGLPVEKSTDKQTV